MGDLGKIGLGLLGSGSVLFFLGILFLMDRALLIMSNILILMGILLIMGFNGFLNFVIQKDKINGTVAFLVGIILVFAKLPLPGIICEVVGAYWLFGGFLPLLTSLLMNVPFIAQFLPFINKKNDEIQV